MLKKRAIISVHVQPHARKNQLLGVRDGVLYVRLSAPPVEGQANEALIKYLGELLHIRKSSISIERGLTGRNKVVAFEGIDTEQLMPLLSQAVGREAL